MVTMETIGQLRRTKLGFKRRRVSRRHQLNVEAFSVQQARSQIRTRAMGMVLWSQRGGAIAKRGNWGQVASLKARGWLSCGLQGFFRGVSHHQTASVLQPVELQTIFFLPFWAAFLWTTAALQRCLDEPSRIKFER